MIKILLYTPTHGNPESASVSLGFHEASIAFARSTDIEILAGRMFTSCDLVRARSRAVQQFLVHETATHLLHWDSDVVGNRSDLVRILDGMLASGHDFVGVPYPRRGINWTRIAARALESQPTVAELQAEAYDYPYSFGRSESGEAERVEVTAWCVPVEHIGFGFTLTSRACLEKMWNAYAPTLSFGDLVDGQPTWTVALFQLLLPPQQAHPPYAIGSLLSEDYSFCQRWRDIGGSVQMYVGPGSPLHHVGSSVFRGSPEGLIYGS
jgi:hypothetical protein